MTEDQRRQAMRLESAPVPVTRNGGGGVGHVGLAIHVHRIGDGNASLLSIHGVLDLVQTVGAVLFPALVGAPAQVAGARWDTIGVEAGILVKRNEVRCVGSTEDVTAVTTVVATQEDAKGRAASRRITVGRGRVSLDKVSKLTCKKVTNDQCDQRIYVECDKG